MTVLEELFALTRMGEALRDKRDARQKLAELEADEVGRSADGEPAEPSISRVLDVSLREVAA